MDGVAGRNDFHCQVQSARPKGLGRLLGEKPLAADEGHVGRADRIGIRSQEKAGIALENAAQIVLLNVVRQPTV